jgi:hypothetical protein
MGDDALTGLELVIISILLLGAILSLILLADGGVPGPGARVFPGGVVAESMYLSGDGLQPVGTVTGFSAVSPSPARIPVMFRYSNPDRLGLVQLTVSLFIGDTGAIDMDHLNVTWVTRGTYEQIQKSSNTPLVCPNWTIAGKYHLLPGRTADSDDWLEPGEQFLLIICPTESLVPYQGFTLGIYPDGVAYPLRITRTVPPRIQQVMLLY